MSNILLTDFEYLDLVEVFDVEMPLSNEEIGDYWFKTVREDQISILLTFNIYELSAGIIVKDENSGVAYVNLNLSSCNKIKVIDKSKAIIEILFKSQRAILSINGGVVVDLQEIESMG